MKFTLPTPPSTNKLTGNKKGGKGRYKLDEYKSWIAEAGWELKLQKVKPVAPPISFVMFVEYNPRRDLDNYMKAVLDLLVSHQIIPADNQKYVTHKSAIASTKTKGVEIHLNTRKTWVATKRKGKT